jgi:hypothetical protein
LDFGLVSKESAVNRKGGKILFRGLLGFVTITKTFFLWVPALVLVIAPDWAASPAIAADKKPNIVFIMDDDIDMWNIGPYHREPITGRTGE